jgi:hypothetical protein
VTVYGLLIQACGLSHREAAELHGVRADTVKSWSAGRRGAPEGALAELRALHARIRLAADQSREMIRQTAAGVAIEVGYPADDHEARALGFPCVGAWRAMMARVVAEADRRITLVPRGATPATAAAADAHRR